ncbi:TonB-dependent receptor P3 [subsurface metagenome]
MFLENENFAHIFATTAETQTATDQNTESWNIMPREKRLMSYFGRLNYNYAERYLLTLIVRRDGSNKLAAGNRFQTFPSVSAGWIISNENFWGFAPVNFLKLRASWGQNGNIESLDYFQYVSLIEVGVWNYYFNDVLSTGAVPSTLSNKDLVWETSEQIDIGIDIRMLNNKLSLSADYYDKRTKDLLVQASTPGITGNNAPWINAGEVQNTGIEIELSYRDMIGELKYGVNVNFSTNKNEVLSYGNESGSITGVGYGTQGRLMTMFEVGYPIGYFFGFQSDGIFQNEEEVLGHTTNGVVLQPRAEPGDVRFVDVNGDSLINDEDRTMIGNPHPKFLFGMGLDFEYKGFDLSLFFQGTYGNDIYNARKRYDVFDVNLETWIYEERWHGEGTSNEYPRLYYGDALNGNWNRSDILIEDASYLRLKDLRLGYTIPKKITEKAKIDRLYFFVQGTNLLTFTKKGFHGSNPDIGAIWGNLGSGLDFGFYPAAKTYQIGAKITF